MPLVIPLAVLLALLVSYGLATTSRPVSGGFVKWLADKVVNIPFIGGLSVEQVLRLDRFLTQALGTHFQAVSRAGVKWVATLANYVYVVGYWTLYWPIELTHVVAWLVRSHIPHAINARTKPIAQTAANAEAQAKAAAGLAHTIPKTAKGNSTVKEVTTIQHVAMPHAKHWDWINTHWKGITAAVAGAAAIALPVPFGLTIRGIKRRLRKLEAERVGPLAAVAVVALALRKMGLSWLKCPSFARLGRKIGCSGFAFIEELLFIGFSAFVITDLCRFTDLLIKQAEKIRPALIVLVDVEDALVNCHGTEKPIDFALPVLSLPPMPSSSVLAA